MTPLLSLSWETTAFQSGIQSSHDQHIGMLYYQFGRVGYVHHSVCGGQRIGLPCGMKDCRPAGSIAGMA